MLLLDVDTLRTLHDDLAIDWHAAFPGDERQVGDGELPVDEIPGRHLLIRFLTESEQTQYPRLISFRDIRYWHSVLVPLLQDGDL